ncbi:MAG TPA: M23 family metallopeptidase [Thermodesulfobacteriota bacterium]|nr:M23 family metallopeptidase [Thermodesulfobacteriota bacterium]
MKYYINLNILILASLFSFYRIGSASEVSIELTPETVFPGDAFVVEVKSDSIPSGEIGGLPLHFHPLSHGLYRAIFSTDVETKPGKYVIRLTVGEKSVEHPFSVHEKQFPVTRLTLSSEKVFLSPEDQARVEQEDKMLSGLWNKTTEPMWKGKFVSPLSTSISSPFGVIRLINQKVDSRHKGTDYRSPAGQPVRAINSGLVVLAEELFYGGNTVMVNHGGGIFSIYMHLSEFKIKMGERVSKNDVVGLVGSTGRATGPHLHLSVKIAGRSASPESLIALPLD